MPGRGDALRFWDWGTRCSLPHSHHTFKAPGCRGPQPGQLPCNIVYRGRQLQNQLFGGHIFCLFFVVFFLLTTQNKVWRI